MNNKEEFINFFNDISSQLKDVLAKRGINPYLGITIHSIDFISSLIKFNGESTRKAANKTYDYYRKIKSKHYISMLFKLAKSAGLEDDTACIGAYKDLCEEID